MKPVKHIALLRFKPQTTPEQIDAVFQCIGDLKHSIPGIVDYIHGAYSSPEGLNQGFTHGFIMTFDSAASRDRYLPHPEHERAKQAVLPHVESVVVFDFEP